MTQYVTGADWRQFAAEYPDAMRFLSRANLQGEVKALRAELPHSIGGRREWIAARLQSLADIDAAFPALPPLAA